MKVYKVLHDKEFKIFDISEVFISIANFDIYSQLRYYGIIQLINTIYTIISYYTDENRIEGYKKFLRKKKLSELI